VDVESHFHLFTNPFYPIFIYWQCVLYDYAQILYIHLMEYCKLIHITFVINCFSQQGLSLFNVYEIFSKAPPFLQHCLHIFTHVSAIEGLPFTPSMFFILITQSLILYEVIRRMDNEIEHEVGKTKSSHQCVD